MSAGREDRADRLINPRGGAWASSSQDYLHLANLLYEHSAAYARSLDGNCSIYTLVGIPTLFSIFRALLIEANSGMYGGDRNSALIAALAKSANEVYFFAENYAAQEPLRAHLALLYEIRNEIVHPAHTPAGTSHGTPEYLALLRASGLLQSSNNERGDYTWIAQLQSHRLFGHAFAAIEEAASLVLSKHYTDEDAKNYHLQSYSKYRTINI